MGLLRTAGRAAVASSVHGRVQRRQQSRWAEAQAAPVAPAAPAAPPQAPALQAPATPTPAAPAPMSTDVMLAQLRQLGELRNAGVLTDAEFEAQKARILTA